MHRLAVDRWQEHKTAGQGKTCGIIGGRAMTLRQALEKIGNTKTQVFNLSIKQLHKEAYRALEEAIEKIEKEKRNE